MTSGTATAPPGRVTVAVTVQTPSIERLGPEPLNAPGASRVRSRLDLPMPDSKSIAKPSFAADASSGAPVSKSVTARSKALVPAAPGPTTRRARTLVPKSWPVATIGCAAGVAGPAPADAGGVRFTSQAESARTPTVIASSVPPTRRSTDRHARGGPERVEPIDRAQARKPEQQAALREHDPPEVRADERVQRPDLGERPRRARSRRRSRWPPPPSRSSGARSRAAPPPGSNGGRRGGRRARRATPRPRCRASTGRRPARSTSARPRRGRSPRRR